MLKIKQTGRLTPASSETLLTLLETLPGALFVVDDDATTLYANASARTLTGATQEDLCGKSLWRGAAHLVSTALYLAVQKTRQTRAPTEVEYMSPVIQTWLHAQIAPTVGGLVVQFHQGRGTTQREALFPQGERLSIEGLDGLDVGVGLLTPEGILLEVNEVPLAYAQIRREEVIGQLVAETFWWSFSPASQHQLRAAITRASSGETVHFETVVRSGGGMDRHLDVAITPRMDADQHIAYLVLAGLDITEHKRAEAEIRTLIDAIPHFIWTGRPGGYVDYYNQRWRDYTGLSTEQAQGDGWIPCTHPDDRQHTLAVWQNAVQTGMPYEGEHRLRNGMGAYRWFLVRAAPFKDAQGMILKWFGTCTDIHEKKWAEEKVKESEENWRVLAETVPHLVWTTQPDGLVTYWNQRWYDYTGSSPEQALGEEWSQFLHPDDSQHALMVWHHALETGNPYEVEYRLREGQTGAYRWFLARGMPVRDEAGQILKWFGTCTDIEDQKRTEQRKDDFISMASHELRTPLTVVKLQTQLVHRRLEKHSQYEAATALSRMEEPIKQLERLIVELLDVSRIQAGRLEYVRERVDLDALLREIADTMQHTSPSHRILVRGTVGTSLMGDRDQLRRVFTNLLSNAIKYSPDAETVEMDLSTSDGVVTVRVRDHGLGIPREQRDKIFERFYRAAAPTIPGLGMGLYIVTEIVKGHGGTITVDSDVGTGSTFTVTLPRAFPLRFL